MFSLWVILVAVLCALTRAAFLATTGNPTRSLLSAADNVPETEPSSPVVAAKTVKRVHWVIDPIDTDPANLKYNQLRKGTAVPREAEFNPAIHSCRNDNCYNCLARNGRVPSRVPMAKLEREDYVKMRRAERTVFPISKRLEEFILYEYG